MKVSDTPLDNVKILQPELYSDERGSVFEGFSIKRIEQTLGINFVVAQLNCVHTQPNAIRGLHFQGKVATVSKLVSVLQGEIFDVAVDLRVDSPSLGHWFGVRLNSDNRKQMFVPNGFAHGLVATQPDTIVVYAMNGYYDPSDEYAITWNDPDLDIEWPLTGEPILSKRDRLESLSWAQFLAMVKFKGVSR